MFARAKSKRESPRVRLTAQARFSADDEIQDNTASIIDLSMSGLSLVADKSPQLHREYNVRLNIYPNIEFSLKGQFVWMTNENGTVSCGLEFKDQGFAKKLKLQELIVDNLKESAV